MSRRAAIIACVAPAGTEGGAERLFTGLLKAMNDHWGPTDLIQVPVDESTFEGIEAGYLRCYDLDVGRYDLVISTKAPTYCLRHPNHVCYLVHTMRVFYDMFEASFPRPTPAQEIQRSSILALDNAALNPSRIRNLFAIGHEVAKRLRQWNALHAEVIHPPLPDHQFKLGETGDYLFLPGRLHRWKRVDLVIDAMRHTRSDVRLLIAGTGEDSEMLHASAADMPQVEFLGRVSDEALGELYANALAVPFAPQREDYGYVTLEAFASGKAVITCTDSGEPNAFVRDGVSGFVRPPDPVALAACFDALFIDRAIARDFGMEGRRAISDIRWDRTIEQLTRSAA